MLNLQDVLIIFFVLNILVWISRAWHLRRTQKQTPEIQAVASILNPPLVSVIIPAKNEEKNIEECVKRFQSQTYRNLEIIVVNDNSKDRTEAILRSLGVFYLNAPPAPEGWTGKNAALYHGVKHAKGEWLLFTDADTRHEPESVSSAMAHALLRRIEFLTLLPRCLSGSWLEDLIQPLAMALMGLWFPMQKVNDPASPLFFANGQYILIKRTLYGKIGGHEAVKHAFLEDFAMAEKTKKTGARFECALGMEVYGTRMYDSLGALWRGWRRIYLHAFQRNPLTIAVSALSLLFFSILPFVSFMFIPNQNLLNPAMFFGAAGILLIWIITWKGYEVLKTEKVRYALAHPVAAVFMMLILGDAFIAALTNRKTVWR